MPSKKHWRKRAAAAEKAPIPIPEVIEADRKLFGGLSLWAARYVNHVYANAGVDGKPLRKIWNEAIYWQNDRWVLSQVPSTSPGLFVHARGRMKLKYPSFGSEADHAEYERQKKLGTELSVESRTFPHSEERFTTEHLVLEFDADGVVINGSYRWYGARDEDRELPDAKFSGIEEAHTRGVSARGAFLLGAFRELALTEGVERGFNTALIVGNWEAIRVPEELIPIPEFI